MGYILNKGEWYELTLWGIATEASHNTVSMERLQTWVNEQRLGLCRLADQQAFHRAKNGRGMNQTSHLMVKSDLGVNTSGMLESQLTLTINATCSSKASNGKKEVIAIIHNARNTSDSINPQDHCWQFTQRKPLS